MHAWLPLKHTGEQGTGYYTDSPLHLRHKSAAAAAKKPPAVLKSSSIVKGLRKPAALPAAKKQKTGRDGGARQVPPATVLVASVSLMLCPVQDFDSMHTQPVAHD